jgi:hypothetical protein
MAKTKAKPKMDAKLKSSKKKNVSPKPRGKKAAATSAPKAASRVAKLNKRVRKLVHVEALDQILLAMAAKPYDQILKKIELGKKRLNEERRIALQLGTRILNRAKKVRDSLISKNS